MHQPGAQTVIGRSYPDTGVEQGRAVLAALARHPATAKHVATKLARHFIADEPPPALVERLAKRFLATAGRSEGAGEGAGDRARGLGCAARQAQASRRMDHRVVARRRRHAARYRSRHAGAQSAGRAAVAAVGAQGLRRRERALARRPGAAPRHRQCSSRAASAARPIRARCSRRRSRRSPRPKRARQSRAPKAARRRWRCCSWRRRFRGDDAVTASRHAPDPPPSCCWPPARCSPGPICRSSRARRAAIRACW